MKGKSSTFGQLPNSTKIARAIEIKEIQVRKTNMKNTYMDWRKKRKEEKPM